MRIFSVPALFLVVACAAVAGCSDHPYGGHADAPFSYPNIAVEEPDLRDNLKFGTPVIEPSTEASPMRVTVPLRNIHDQELNVQYRFEFIGSDRRPLTTNLGWVYARLPVRIETSLDANAMQSSAADWRLVIRSAR